MPVFSLKFAFLTSLLIAANALPALDTRETLPQVITKCTKPNTAALTFDDGPYQYIYDISKTLLAAGAKGTFFMNGNNYGCIYSAENVARVKYAYSKGHQIASHTWSHAHLTTLSETALKDEFSKVDQAMQRIIGVTPAFVRPPYGEYNDQVRKTAADRGQRVVNWDFDSGDSLGKSADESNHLYDQLAKSHPSTILTLNHEVYEPTAHKVLPHAISVLQAKGYNLVTVAECLGMTAYQNVGQPQTGSWSC